MMVKHSTAMYWVLFLSAMLGFCTSYFPGVVGHPPAFWLSDLIATLSYFTIISNLLVAFMAGAQCFAPNSPLAVRLNSALVQTAIAGYITITGVVYHLLLADTWTPEGWDIISDKLLHTVTPILYALFWWTQVRGKPMSFAKTFPPLIVPFLFLIYWLIRGPIVGSYPYFFMDVNELGALQVAINLTGLSILFWLVTVFYWTLNRYTTPLYV